MNQPGNAAFVRFVEMLQAVADLYGKTISDMQAAMYFRALSGYPIEAVQSAFDAHVKDPERGRFMPTPADLIAKLDADAENDGRPIPEEAWSIAIRALDERDTVVWTEEIARAWHEVGHGLMECGDKFNASRGFIARYQQLVKEARRERRKAVWMVSQGSDLDLRHMALETAYRANLIGRETVKQMLPRHKQDAGPIVAAIAGKTVTLIGDGKHADGGCVEDIKRAGERLKEIAQKLRESAPAVVRAPMPSIEDNMRIVNRAIEEGVLKSVRDIEHWTTKARSRESLQELQAMIMNKGRVNHA